MALSVDTPGALLVKDVSVVNNTCAVICEQKDWFLVCRRLSVCLLYLLVLVKSFKVQIAGDRVPWDGS